MGFHEYPNIYVTSVTLKVSDLQRAITFYEKIIGFQTLTQDDKKAALSADGKTAFVLLEELDEFEKKATRTTGLYHFAILVPTREDLGVILKHLVTSGYPLQGASDHNVSEAIYLADPDGNGIEIYRDREPKTWEWDSNLVKMDTFQMDAEGVLAAAGNTEWNGLPSGTILGHIHLHVADLDKTVQFYVEALGFEIVQKYGSQAYFISTGNYHHHIGLNIWNGIGAPAPKENNIGLKYYDVKLPDKKSRDQIIDRLNKMGIKYEQEGDNFSALDPSGNKVRFII
jgi:catechol 2,3-dioxygenase